MTTISTKRLVGAALAASCFYAHAGFIVETPPPKPRPADPSAPGAFTPRLVNPSAPLDRVAKGNRERIDLDSKLSSLITQNGEPPRELPVIRGLGKGVTFGDALRQIIPGGWTAYSDQPPPLEQPVSWTGNRTWPMVLHALLAERDMRAHIDWKNQEVTLFVPAPKPELTEPLRASSTVQVRRTPAPAGVASGASAPATGAPKEIVWTLAPEYTLRENLRRWATAANWNLVWNAVHGESVIDYPVDAKVEFPGELLGTSGAMAKVITAYRDADYPLEIEFFRGNKVVEVRLHRIPDGRARPAAASAAPAR